MASLVPSLNSCASRMQAGERRFARRLISHLEDDYLCWYDLPVGVRPRYADFIILHPARGLLLLEVKDWSLSRIRKVDKNSVELETSSGIKTVPNPLEQVRQYTFKLVDQLRRDPQLVHQDGAYRGRLIMPYGYGVVLSRVTRRQFLETDLPLVLPAHQVICKDEIEEQVDVEEFQKHLWDMFTVQFTRQLTLPQIDRVRWHLFPEVRIQADVQTGLFDVGSEEGAPELEIPDIVKVMDLQQEQLARNLGGGHRVVHGVAGSGKTMILGYRCLYLSQILHKPILVLCYNIALAAKLRSLIHHHQIGNKINIYHFHSWCSEMLRRYHVAVPQGEGDYFDRLVEAVIKAAADGAIPRGQYGAVLIDEGHDLRPEWLRLVVDMVDPSTDSFLLLYDDTQAIYRKSGDLGFALSSVGIQARGRTTVLKLNYRNTDEILQFAHQFVSYYIKAGSFNEDLVSIVEPTSVGRHGPPPTVERVNSFKEECDYVLRSFRKLNSSEHFPWSDMCVTYSHRWMGEELSRRFRDAAIPVTWLCDRRSKRTFESTDAVKLMTMHSSKGLEFSTVAVCGTGYMGATAARCEEDAKLLYVAMTRATERLIVTMSKKTEFTARLLAA